MNYEDFKKLPVDEAIRVAAQYSGFDPVEVDGVWNTESARGQNKGPSKAGAVGDFQIMPNTQASLEKRFGRTFDPTDFHDSLYMGMEVLRENLEKFKDKGDALRAYNSGWDRSKWDNPETQAYVGKVMGKEEQELLGTYMDTKGLPAFTRDTIRLAAIEKSGMVDRSTAGVRSDAFDAVYPQDVQEVGLYDEDAARLSKEQQFAGFSEAALDSMVYNTITGKLVEVAQRGEPDPSFNAMADDNQKQIQAAGLYGNDMMMDYVLGARNSEDFRNRLQVAQERTELLQRVANNTGYGAALGSFVGSMMDPVAIAGSMAAGSALAATRAAAAAGRAGQMLRAGAGGAAENVVAGQMLQSADNQRFSWADVLTDATFGAALGALGGALVKPTGELRNDPGTSVHPDFVPTLNSVARALDEVIQGQQTTAWERAFTRDTADLPEWDGTVSTNAFDFGGESIGDLPPAGPRVRVERTEGGPSRVIGAEEPTLRPANTFNPRLGYTPEPTLSGKAYRDLHQQGIITELRSADDFAKASDFQARYGEELPPDAKAVYLPQDDRVYVFRDRLTQAEVDNPMGLVMHEVGVHYGLERSIGTENYTKVLEALDQSNDARVQAALKAVPGDTPEHLRLEEALGYLVEKHPTLGIVKQVLADIRNWLRKNVRMFRDMEITPEDAIAYVHGSVKSAQRATGRAGGAGTPRYSRVQHATPEFRKWFGNSRVVGDDGKPLVVYHGTAADVAFFDKLALGTSTGGADTKAGFFFTTRPDVASDYATTSLARPYIQRRILANAAESPVLDADTRAMLKWEADKGMTDQEYESAALIKLDNDAGYIAQGSNVVPVYLSLQNPYVKDFGGAEYNPEVFSTFMREAKELGHDGVIITNVDDSKYTARGLGVTYVAFEPEQIKSAIGNRGTFDPKNRDLRYSRSGPQPAPSTLPLSAREQLILDKVMATNTKVSPAMQAQVDRAQAMMNARPEFFKGMEKWAQSPGTTMAASPNALAQKVGALFFENTIGSAGRPEAGSVAMHYDLLLRKYRDTTMDKAAELVTSLMTPKERAARLLGGTGGQRRISTLVAEERARHREAIKRGQKYQSTAPEGIQKLAKLVDDQMFRMVDEGRALGTEYANSVFGSGVEGFAPQVWNWRKFQEAQVNSPQVWEALRKNFTQQYVEKQIDPIWQKMLDEGVDPMEMQAVRDRLMQQIEHQVNTRLFESVTDPNTRTRGDMGKFESMASQLLYENFAGTNVTHDVVGRFRELLADHINDRTRTEFDMMREVDGVRLLDYVDHDLVNTISHTAHLFAGQNAMAKRGFKTKEDFYALVDVMRKQGARPIDIELTQFAGRAFGFDNMILKDGPMLAALRNFTFAAMMGKLGIAQLADAAALVSATGMSSIGRLFGAALSKESPLVTQLQEMYGPGMVGKDYRIQSFMADIQPNGRALSGAGERILKVSQRGAQLVSWISGNNHITRVLHKAFLPVLAENIVRAVRGLDGGMTPARLADAGLSPETAARIKQQLDKYEPSRKEGEAFNWEKWDDQYAADKLIESMHRVTNQVFNRAMTGEAAMWRTESPIGVVAGQFHNYGLTAMGKQLARNVSIMDANAATSAAIGMAWSALLYYGRLQTNTMGMSNADAQEYMDRNTTPGAMARGVLTYFNMSGIGAEVFGLGEVVFGGNSYQAGSGPVAAAGYVTNVSRALNAAGNLATGSDNPGKDAGNILRILPGGNSIPGTFWINSMRD